MFRSLSNKSFLPPYAMSIKVQSSFSTHCRTLANMTMYYYYRRVTLLSTLFVIIVRIIWRIHMKEIFSKLDNQQRRVRATLSLWHKAIAASRIE